MDPEGGVPDYLARRPGLKAARTLLPVGGAGDGPVKLGRWMIMVLVVAMRTEHQQAEKEIIAGEEAARADDLGPAVVVDEAFAQQRVGLGR